MIHRIKMIAMMKYWFELYKHARAFLFHLNSPQRAPLWQPNALMPAPIHRWPSPTRQWPDRRVGS
jgi:hypothetical protein